MADYDKRVDVRMTQDMYDRVLSYRNDLSSSWDRPVSVVETIRLLLWHNVNLYPDSEPTPFLDDGGNAVTWTREDD